MNKSNKIIIIDDKNKKMYYTNRTKLFVFLANTYLRYVDYYGKYIHENRALINELTKQGYKYRSIPRNPVEIITQSKKKQKEIWEHCNKLFASTNHVRMRYILELSTKTIFNIYCYNITDEFIIRKYTEYIDGLQFYYSRADLSTDDSYIDISYECKRHSNEHYYAYIKGDTIFIVPHNSFANMILTRRSLSASDFKIFRTSCSLEEVFTSIKRKYTYSITTNQSIDNIIIKIKINGEKSKIPERLIKYNNEKKQNYDFNKRLKFNFENPSFSDHKEISKTNNAAVFLLSYFNKSFPQWKNSCSNENGLFNHDLAKSYFRRTILDSSQCDITIRIARVLYDWIKTKAIFRFEKSVFKMVMNVSKTSLDKRFTYELKFLMLDSMYIQLTGLQYRSQNIDGAFLDIDSNTNKGYLAIVIRTDNSYTISCVHQFKLSDISITRLIESISEKEECEFYHSLFKLLICLYESSSNRLFRVQNGFKTVSETSENSVKKNNLFESIYVQLDQDVWNQIISNNSENGSSRNNHNSDKPKRRPHIRMGHLHTYWIGSKKDNTRKTITKYVRATMVKGNNTEYDIPVSINTIRLYSK